MSVPIVSPNRFAMASSLLDIVSTVSNSPLTSLISSERTEFTNSLILVVIFSNDPPVASNSKAISFVNSV